MIFFRLSYFYVLMTVCMSPQASHADSFDHNAYSKLSSFIFSVMSYFPLFDSNNKKSVFIEHFVEHMCEIQTMHHEMQWFFSLEKMIATLNDEHT